jgi:uncharacterized protein DUF6894
MTEVNFQYSNARGVLIDRNRTDLDDMAEAREHAEGLVRSLIMRPSTEDWRGWSCTLPTTAARRSLKRRSQLCSASRIRRTPCSHNRTSFRCARALMES